MFLKAEASVERWGAVWSGAGLCGFQWTAEMSISVLNNTNVNCFHLHGASSLRPSSFSSATALTLSPVFCSVGRAII